MSPVRVLVVNAGSSSLKLSVVDVADGPESVTTVARRTVDGWDGNDLDALGELIEHHQGVDAVGHRIVHGGETLTGAVVLDDTTMERVAELEPLAPLHQPRSIAGIDAARAVLSAVPHVGCFDTAFHTTMPPHVTTYPLPEPWRDAGVRRYGFHGLSHAWSARRAPELLGDDHRADRVVVAHLGAGASLCAVREGRSVDTTMGFTPLDGIVMATRPGSLDPGIVPWVLRTGLASLDEIDHALAHESGIAALSGTSGDLRDVFSAADAGDPRAQLALDVVHHRLAAGVAAMATSLGGLDLLVFTGGVGENQPRVRAELCRRLGFLGVVIDEQQNRGAEPDALLSPPGVEVAVAVVQAREDVQIAGEVAAVVA